MDDVSEWERRRARAKDRLHMQNWGGHHQSWKIVKEAANVVKYESVMGLMGLMSTPTTCTLNETRNKTKLLTNIISYSTPQIKRNKDEVGCENWKCLNWNKMPNKRTWTRRFPSLAKFLLLTIPLLSELCFSPRELREVLQCLGGEAWKKRGRGRTLVGLAGGDLQLHH